MRMLIGVAVAVLPATSEQVAEAEPEAAKVCDTVGLTGPELVSVQVQVTVTGPLLQPAALIGTILCIAVVGGVLSIRMVGVTKVAAFPATSRQVPVTVVPLVSAMSVVLPVGLL